jgi:hypothetical protein
LPDIKEISQEATKGEMNTLNLNRYVDSSSIPYLRWVVKQAVMDMGLDMGVNPFSSGFVSLAALIAAQEANPDIAWYPLYSRGKGVN